MTNRDLIDHLAAGHTYLWALRQAHAAPADGPNPLAAVGIDTTTLEALRALDAGIARFPEPTHTPSGQDYYTLDTPTGGVLHFAPLVTEHGVESGMEVFASQMRWSFAHDEVQYCTGGETLMKAELVHGAREDKVLHPGDVMLIPENTLLTHQPTGASAFNHSHIYGTNLSRRPRVFYDGVPRLALERLGWADSGLGIPPRVGDVADQVEVADWAELVESRPHGARQRPTWLRNGWEQREATRAVDYEEGVRSLVIASPDRPPERYLEWGTGVRRCFVNPLISEAGAGITDCVFPDGWESSLCWTELWTVLRGEAQVEQTLAPLHTRGADAHVRSGSTLVVPGGSRVRITGASGDLVVRRLAGSCAHNAQWAMMEAKLVADGVPDELARSAA